MAEVGKPDRILIIEDDPDVTEVVQLSLRKAGYETCAAPDGQAGLRAFYAERPDLVVLDITLPKLDGWELCRRLRELAEVPIIILTGHSQLEQRIRGLDLGADDYLTKPFAPAELAARVRGVLRRHRTTPPVQDERYADRVLTVDFGQRRTTVHGREVTLSAKEFGVLAYLVKNAGRLLTSDQILDRVWGMEYYSQDTVKQYISYVRRKIEEDPQHPQLITTVRGMGYRYNPQR
jgi:two-component system KDP operon response regulator KdpE